MATFEASKSFYLTNTGITGCYKQYIHHCGGGLVEGMRRKYWSVCCSFLPRERSEHQRWNWFFNEPCPVKPQVCKIRLHVGHVIPAFDIAVFSCTLHQWFAHILRFKNKVLLTRVLQNRLELRRFVRMYWKRNQCAWPPVMAMKMISVIIIIITMQNNVIFYLFI